MHRETASPSKPADNHPKAVQSRRQRPIAVWLPRFLLVLSVVLLFVQALSMGRRGGRGETDVGVFYRTTVLLDNGIGPKLYTMKDARDGWPIAIPPAGLAIFQPLSDLDTDTSSTLWAIFNLVLAFAAVEVLRRFFCELNAKQRLHQAVFPYAAALFMLLASGSLQVGQYSLLFAACWIFALYAATKKSRPLVAIMFALPSAIKIYPALLLAAPLSTVRNFRSAFTAIGWFTAAFVVYSFVVPLFFYGDRTLALNVSFWDNTIFNPAGRVAAMQSLDAQANQSLDAVLLRFLSFDKEFHLNHPQVPHLNLPAETVLQIANVLRLIVLGLTGVLVLRWRKHVRIDTPYTLLSLAALWSATLYLILPETRARYAVYTFLAFVPLIVSAFAAHKLGRRREHVLQVSIAVICFLLVLSFIPYSLRTFGVGFLGSLVLWLVNLTMLNLQMNPAKMRSPISAL